MSNFYIVELTEFYNNNGISYQGKADSADFTGNGSSFPAKDLPESNKIVKIGEVPFLFPPKERNLMNNFDLFNQKISVPENLYTWIHILGASENGSFEEKLVFSSENDKYATELGLTDYTEVNSKYDEKVGFRCKGMNTKTSGYLSGFMSTIWYKSIDVSNARFYWDLMEFPDNASMHIFAITLESKGDE